MEWFYFKTISNIMVAMCSHGGLQSKDQHPWSRESSQGQFPHIYSGYSWPRWTLSIIIVINRAHITPDWTL